ncbi:hypothetical protein [Paenibacillus sp. GCM10027626]|uniref:hypothetical protein n=1 Tax=Paenibacillus sp. GCM10027626 TaxID=3273411 RepID=UPI00363D574A
MESGAFGSVGSPANANDAAADRQGARLVSKQLEKLHAACFACENDARQAIDAFQKQQKWKWHTCDYAVQAETTVLPRTKRGRPKADELPQTEIRWMITTADVRLRDETVLDKTQKLGMFVLMTSHAQDAL